MNWRTLEPISFSSWWLSCVLGSAQEILSLQNKSNWVLSMIYVYIYLLAPILVWLSYSVSPKAKWCLISTGKARWHVAGFSMWKFGICLKALEKHRLGPHRFENQTSKPPCMFSPKSHCQNHVSTANLQKLRFYQNKGLSLDRRCGVLNTFPTCNQISALKNQNFLPSTLD